MTTLPKAPRYHAKRKTRTEGVGAAQGSVDPAEEALTGQQLRMARRAAQKHGLKVSSDLDAVRQLRARGIDPFKQVNILQVIKSEEQQKASEPDKKKAGLPAKREKETSPATATPPQHIEADTRARELRQLQRDIARRRRRNIVLLALRVAFFVGLPTLLAGYYFTQVATPMYATKSEFIIQQAEPAAASGLGGLFQGTSMATQQDSISVQSYLGSREAMLRLDEEYGFREHFSDPSIDPLQRLGPNASLSDAYNIYTRRIELSYDPTEGLVRMEVVAASPEKSLEFSNALIGYAEEQVDHMTARLRRDQMSGAREVYESAENARNEALQVLTEIQSEAEVLDPAAENAALMSRIANLEQQRDQLTLELSSLLDNPSPNAARVNATQARIDRIDSQIVNVRNQITQGQQGRLSQTEISARLREAEENYQARLLLVQDALRSMESARQEANRQVRYLSMSVRPIPPDSPSYPRAFENTAVAFLIFSGIYLMMAMTAAIIREQVSA